MGHAVDRGLRFWEDGKGQVSHRTGQLLWMEAGLIHAAMTSPRGFRTASGVGHSSTPGWHFSRTGLGSVSDASHVLEYSFACDPS